MSYETSGGTKVSDSSKEPFEGAQWSTFALPHHTVDEFAGDDGSLVLGCGDRFIVAVSF